jgi:hypothetical protein
MGLKDRTNYRDRDARWDTDKQTLRHLTPKSTPPRTEHQSKSKKQAQLLRPLLPSLSPLASSQFQSTHQTLLSRNRKKENSRTPIDRERSVSTSSSPWFRDLTPLQALLRSPVRPGPHGRHLPLHILARQFLPESSVHQLRREVVGEDLADVGCAGVGRVQGGD